jgi:hypothetical protein
MLGEQVAFTAVVSAPGFAGTPTGTVTFTIDGHEKAPVPLSFVGGQYEAQFVTSTLTVGKHTVTAAYSGDTKVSDSGGSLPTQTVSAPTPAPSTTTLKSSLNPSTVGESVTFTAVVNATGFQGTPTGTVTFTIDGHTETPVPLKVVGGVDEARFTTSTLTAGQHAVAATYSGDAKVSGSAGSLPKQTVNTVNSHPTVITLSSALNPSTVGQDVTFTAVVSAGPSAGMPTGTVTFTIDGTSQPPVALSLFNGHEQASFATSNLSAGKHSINARYNGNSAFASSTPSSPLTQTVNLLPTTAILGSSANPSTVGEQIVFTATVDPPGGTRIPTGDVTFTIDGHKEPPVPLREVGGSIEAAFSISTLTAGTHKISATYDGDTTFAASNPSGPITEIVHDPAVEGPKVVKVLRYGVHWQPTVLVLSFSAALDPTSAQDPRNYVIVGPEGGRDAIGTAVYDPTTHTVTLRPRSRIDIHYAYRLTVVGTGADGVTGADGTRLGAVHAGDPGQDFVTTLTWRNLVLTPDEVAKYLSPRQTHPAGALSHRFGAKMASPTEAQSFG